MPLACSSRGADVREPPCGGGGQGAAAETPPRLLPLCCLPSSSPLPCSQALVSPLLLLPSPLPSSSSSAHISCLLPARHPILPRHQEPPVPCRPESCQGWGERSTHLPAPAAHLPTHPLLLLTPRTPCCRSRARRGKSLCFFLWGGGEGLFTSAYTPQLPLPPPSCPCTLLLDTLARRALFF